MAGHSSAVSPTAIAVAKSITRLETTVETTDISLPTCQLKCTWVLSDIQSDELLGAVPNHSTELQKPTAQDN